MRLYVDIFPHFSNVCRFDAIEAIVERCKPELSTWNKRDLTVFYNALLNVYGKAQNLQKVEAFYQVLHCPCCTFFSCCAVLRLFFVRASCKLCPLGFADLSLFARGLDRVA